jgi:hypothetical protein
VAKLWGLHPNPEGLLEKKRHQIAALHQITLAPDVFDQTHRGNLHGV